MSQGGTSQVVSAAHWTLSGPIEISRISPLYGKLGIRLSSDNYVAWARVISTALKTVDLFGYCEGNIAQPKDAGEMLLWRQADLTVQTVLLTNMEPGLVSQLDAETTAAEAWRDIKRLFAGQTTADYTLTMANLITTKYDGEGDVIEHLMKMKGYRRDLILMNRDVPDEIFACFLRLSMPQEWNYVFAGLVDPYTPKDVESRIRAENSNRSAQSATATAFRTNRMHGKKGKSNPKEQSKGPTCSNCKKSGHVAADCWSKGGGAEEKGPQRGKKEGKGKKGKASRADADDSDSDIEEEDDICLMARGLECPSANVSDECDSEIVSLYDSSVRGSEDICLMARSPNSSSQEWYKDSGSTTHICKERFAFVKLKACKGSVGGIDAKSLPLEVKGIGDVQLKCFLPGGQVRHVTLKNVYYCPNARDNLISEGRMLKAGMTLVCEGKMCTAKRKDGKVMFVGHYKHSNLCIIDCAVDSTFRGPSDVAYSSKPLPGIDIWHRRLGHLSEGGLKELIKNKMVKGLEMSAHQSLGPCEGCAKGKHPSAPFPKKGSRAKSILRRLHMDLQGPFETASIFGYKYSLSIVDCHSRYGWKIFLKKKDDTAEEIKAFIAYIEKQTDLSVRKIRCDGGTEFLNKVVKNFCREKGIAIETSVPYTPQQNGVAERFHRTTHEHALAMLQEAKMAKGFWPEAHDYACLTRNYSPTKILSKATPYEVFWGEKPDVSMLRIFGSKCHVRVPPEKRRKLDTHSLDGIFCGFAEGSKAYRVWIPSKHRFASCRDVIVYESVPLLDNTLEDDVPPAQNKGVPSLVPVSTGDTLGTPESSISPGTSDTQPENIERSSRPRRPSIEPHPNPDEPRQPRVSRPSWKKREMEREREGEPRETPSIAGVALACSVLSSGDVPTSYREAINCPDAEEWNVAMKEEFDMLTQRKTWELVDLPPGCKATGSRWTYDLKRGPDGQITRYKARFVVQGFSQIPGIDYSDTFSPTVRLDTLRMLLHLAACFGWHRAQDDVKGAFLHSEVDHDIYIKQPQGFDDGTGRVGHLLRSLYGLKQASRLWNQYMHAKLIGLGWEQLQTDNAVYCHRSSEGMAFIAIHVDNFLSFAESEKRLRELQKELHLTFEMKEEDPGWVMGFHITEDRASQRIKINHSLYIETILRRFNLSDCNPVSTPMEPGLHLSKRDSPTDPDEIQEMQRVPYRELVGSLLWTSLICHPEITFAVTQLARFNSNPGKRHWEAAKRVLRYLKGVKDNGLELGGSARGATQVRVYSDASWAEEIDDRHSISGYVVQLGQSVVSWSSKKQTTVATSSTEAEYMAASYSARHTVWVRNLLDEMGMDIKSWPTLFLIDNKGAIDLTKESRHHQRTKHIDVAHHFVREKVQSGDLEVTHCKSSEMLADGFTKALARPAFLKMKDNLRVVSE